MFYWFDFNLIFPLFSFSLISIDVSLFSSLKSCRIIGMFVLFIFNLYIFWKRIFIRNSSEYSILNDKCVFNDGLCLQLFCFEWFFSSICLEFIKKHLPLQHIKKEKQKLWIIIHQLTWQSCILFASWWFHQEREKGYVCIRTDRRYDLEPFSLRWERLFT